MPEGLTKSGAPPAHDAVADGLIAAHGRPVRLPAGTVVFRPGDTCEHVVLLTTGTIRVRLVSETGREIQLYRVGPGETCAMTVACLMNAGAYSAEGIAETALEGRALGREAFRALLASSVEFRDKVLATQTQRILDLAGLVEHLAFRGTEARLAAHLISRATADGFVAETHQQLALDVGTAREVVSRRLKRLEDEGIVALERGRLRIVDPARLRALATGT